MGTYFQPGVVSPLFQWGAKILDEAVAWYLPAHVMDGYKFLMQNWNTGDKVCLFGNRQVPSLSPDCPPSDERALLWV